MRKMWSTFLAVAICGLLAGCGGNHTADIDESGEPNAASSDTETTATRVAYSTALAAMIESHTFPDGSDIDFADSDSESACAMAKNQFAVCDVDHDGKEELLLLYTTSCMAGMRGAVFAYDSDEGTLSTQLDEFPALTFYENGIVKAEWSHNQGLGGDFWPYTLYQYSPDSDSYVFVGSVDAWDKKRSDAAGPGKSFPDDIDTSGTGFVYYIMDDEKYDNTNPVDAAVYEQWRNALIGCASECQIAYLDLTADNIAQIGK